MTDWSQLDHAYGAADDIPGLLARADPDERSPVWEELWSRLLRRLAPLMEIAGHWSSAERIMPLALAGDIVSSVDRPGTGRSPRRTACTRATPDPSGCHCCPPIPLS